MIAVLKALVCKFIFNVLLLVTGKAVVVRIGDGDSLIVKCVSLPTPVLPSTATNTATTSKSLPSTPTATSTPDKGLCGY